jgi:ParB/RepB/Spo0J family partition protein
MEKKKKSGAGRKQAPVANASITPKSGIPMELPVTDIDPSPFNYRRLFPAESMQELTASVTLHGIIESLTVRPGREGRDGRFELVAGERRLRAAQAAGLATVPILVRDLTDDEVREIQLTENLQREDPHPLDEAAAIQILMEKHQSIEAIAARLGKSKTFILGRIRLLDLIEPIREMFMAGIFHIGEALAIAALSPETQEQFFADYCSNWQEPDFEKPSIPDDLDPYLQSLAQAPFDVQDEGLLPAAGACTRCPFNSAVVQTLFPDGDPGAHCMKDSCYRQKCQAAFTRTLAEALRDGKPAALLFYGQPSSRLIEVLAQIPEAATLPQYNVHRVDTEEAPEPPDSEVYGDDHENFAEAQAEYEEELASYQDKLQKGELLPRLLVTDRGCRPLLFHPGSFDQEEGREGAPLTVISTAAALDSAIKAGTARARDIESGMDRIRDREVRLAELDREKVQGEVHAALTESLKWPPGDTSLTEADTVAMRYILLMSLDWSALRDTKAAFFDSRRDLDEDKPADLYTLLAGLSDEEARYLVRTAILNRPDSKSPTHPAGRILYQLAAQAGTDVAAIESAQSAKAEKRHAGQEKRLAALQKHLDNLKKKEVQSAAA